jgi:hypothetical protein
VIEIGLAAARRTNDLLNIARLCNDAGVVYQFLPDEQEQARRVS